VFFESGGGQKSFSASPTTFACLSIHHQSRSGGGGRAAGLCTIYVLAVLLPLHEERWNRYVLAGLIPFLSSSSRESHMGLAGKKDRSKSRLHLVHNNNHNNNTGGTMVSLCSMLDYRRVVGPTILSYRTMNGWNRCGRIFFFRFSPVEFWTCCFCFPLFNTTNSQHRHCKSVVMNFVCDFAETNGDMDQAPLASSSLCQRSLNKRRQYK
jgi:hypothetical protein